MMGMTVLDRSVSILLLEPPEHVVGIVLAHESGHLIDGPVAVYQI